MKTVLPHTASDFCIQDEHRKFRSVAKEEFEQLIKADMSKLEEALEKGRQDRLAAERAYNAPPISSMRFR